MVVDEPAPAPVAREPTPAPTVEVPKTEDVVAPLPPAPAPAPVEAPPAPLPKKPKRVSQAALKATSSQAQLAAQRREELLRDPHVRAVAADAVQCAACGVWVKLGDALYAGHKWDGRMGHKARCPELLKKCVCPFLLRVTLMGGAGSSRRRRRSRRRRTFMCPTS